MFGLSILTGAWWAAKALFVKDTVGRFFNGQMLAAVAIAGVFALILIGGWFVAHELKASGAAELKAVFSQQSLVQALRNRVRDRRTAEAAARERERLVDQLRETAEHAASLEQELARLAANPV